MKIQKSQVAPTSPLLSKSSSIELTPYHHQHLVVYDCPNISTRGFSCFFSHLPTLGILGKGRLLRLTQVPTFTAPSLLFIPNCK